MKILCTTQIAAILKPAFDAHSCPGSTSRVPSNVIFSAATPSRIRDSATDRKDDPLSPGPSSTTMNLEPSRCCFRTQSLWLSLNSAHAIVRMAGRTHRNTAGPDAASSECRACDRAQSGSNTPNADDRYRDSRTYVPHCIRKISRMQGVISEPFGMRNAYCLEADGWANSCAKVFNLFSSQSLPRNSELNKSVISAAFGADGPAAIAQSTLDFARKNKGFENRCRIETTEFGDRTEQAPGQFVPLTPSQQCVETLCGSRPPCPFD